MDTTTGTIELFGSNIEKNVKEASANYEILWQNINIENPGLYLWKVRNFKLETVSQNNIGTFYEGNSYLILCISQLPNNALTFNIHFWLGKETTIDEMGTVAYKTVELDTFLHGRAIQHREVQENESDLFRSYFPAGINYKLGGIETGFKTVKAYDYSKYNPILYRIKNNSVTQIPFDLANITENDSFILDAGLTINKYDGKNSSHKERLFTEYYALNIKDCRKDSNIVIVDNINVFTDTINSLASKQGKAKELYRITESDNKVNISKVDGDINLKSFDSNDTFLFYCSHATYLWIGKNSSYNELLNAWKLAFKITESTDPISVVKEGAESQNFLLSLN